MVETSFFEVCRVVFFSKQKIPKVSQLLLKTVAGNKTILPIGQILQVFGNCYNKTLMDQMLILKAVGQSNNGIFLQEEH